MSKYDLDSLYDQLRSIDIEIGKNQARIDDDPTRVFGIYTDIELKNKRQRIVNAIRETKYGIGSVELFNKAKNSVKIQNMLKGRYRLMLFLNGKRSQSHLIYRSGDDFLIMEVGKSNNEYYILKDEDDVVWWTMSACSDLRKWHYEDLWSN